MPTNEDMTQFSGKDRPIPPKNVGHDPKQGLAPSLGHQTSLVWPPILVASENLLFTMSTMCWLKMVLSIPCLGLLMDSSSVGMLIVCTLNDVQHVSNKLSRMLLRYVCPKTTLSLKGNSCATTLHLRPRMYDDGTQCWFWVCLCNQANFVSTYVLARVDLLLSL